MHSKAYTLIFTTTVAVVAALLLSFTAMKLKPLQEENVKLDRKKNILLAMGVVKAGAEVDINKAYSESGITQVFVDNTGKILDYKNEKFNFAKELKEHGVAFRATDDVAKLTDIKLEAFIRKENGKVQNVVIPIIGKGLWSTLKGYLALQSDCNTVAGITFYSHAETPGLGGEIEKDWFLKKFVGKKIFASDGTLKALRIVKGTVNPSSPTAMHEVDGISGATLTGDGVNDLLLKDLSMYEPYFKMLKKAK